MPEPEPARWGRLAFTGGCYHDIRNTPTADGSDPAGVPGFRPEFDEVFRAQYARAVEQAQEFVAFVDPQPGSAVVEVGAGNGRITFDGGLAERIGPTGQLLVTDPSTAQLNAVARRATEAGMTWVRALQARAEELPLVDGTADLALGAVFLHFTDRNRAVAEMARVVRPGGAVAVCAPLAYPWPDAWWEMLQPVRAELRSHGLTYRHFLPTAEDVLAAFAAAGLHIERADAFGPEVSDFLSVDLTISAWRQVGLVPLSLRGVPPSRHAPVQEAFEQRVREVFARTTREERRISAYGLNLVARRTNSAE